MKSSNKYLKHDFSFTGLHFKRNFSRCLLVDEILDDKHLDKVLRSQGWNLSKEQIKYLAGF